MKKNPQTDTKATALKYDGEAAPKLVAKGSGLVAEQIIAVAKENNIHIHNDPILLEVLSRLELGDEIPQQLYLAVAKIIAFAYFLQGKHPKNKTGQSPKDEPLNNRLSDSENSDNLPI